jgi:hypothetical protein
MQTPSDRSPRLHGLQRRLLHLDLRSPSSGLPRFPQNAILLKRIKVIWVVQSHIKKFSISRLTQISRISLAVPPLRGAFRDRHEREAGCGGRKRRF